MAAAAESETAMLHTKAVALASAAADAAERGMLETAILTFTQAVEVLMKETELLKRAGRGGEAKARKLAAHCLQTAEELKQRLAAGGGPRTALSSSGSAHPPPSAPPMLPPVTPPAGPSGTQDDARRRMLQGVVQLSCGRSSGSGTVVTSRGHILTNAHVVEGDDPVFVACNLDLKSEPITRYIARPLIVDRKLDLALLHIVADYYNQHLVDFPVDLDPVPLGDSHDLSIGDTLWIVGFPGLGGGTVTLTQGIVSGFLDDGQWIKTDAEINPGNSGGGAFRDGRLVAVASAAASERSTAPQDAKVRGKLGLLRPLHLARPLVSSALRSSGP